MISIILVKVSVLLIVKCKCISLTNTVTRLKYKFSILLSSHVRFIDRILVPDWIKILRNNISIAQTISSIFSSFTVFLSFCVWSLLHAFFMGRIDDREPDVRKLFRSLLLRTSLDSTEKKIKYIIIEGLKFRILTVGAGPQHLDVCSHTAFHPSNARCILHRNVIRYTKFPIKKLFASSNFFL